MPLPTAELRRRRRAAGHCRDCSKPAEAGKVYCPYHAELNREKSRARRRAAAIKRERDRFLGPIEDAYSRQAAAWLAVSRDLLPDSAPTKTPPN